MEDPPDPWLLPELPPGPSDGATFPLLPGERVVFSRAVSKINRRNKPQERLLLLTSAGSLLSLTPSLKLRRRIALERVDTITIGTSELTLGLGLHELCLHVRGEYGAALRVAAPFLLTFSLLLPFFFHLCRHARQTTATCLMRRTPIASLRT